MKNNLTYIVFVVDRSGSMSSIAKDMIGGYNSLIKSQREANLGECKVFFNQFDTEYETVYSAVSLQDVKELTDKTFIPRGGTALYCSMGKTIAELGKRLESMSESERPSKVLIVTITDGGDNSVLSNAEDLYTLEQVKQMITHQTDVYNWDFAYIGANQDAWNVGDSMGVKGNTKLGYIATAAGTAAMFDSLSASTISYRSAGNSAKFAFANSTTSKNP